MNAPLGAGGGWPSKSEGGIKNKNILSVFWHRYFARELTSTMILRCEHPASCGMQERPIKIYGLAWVSLSSTSSLVFDCLNTKLSTSLDTVLHGFEFLGGMPLPINDLTNYAKRALRAV